jgi:hypothetical protein
MITAQGDDRPNGLETDGRLDVWKIYFEFRFHDLRL